MSIYDSSGIFTNLIEFPKSFLKNGIYVYLIRHFVKKPFNNKPFYYFKVGYCEVNVNKSLMKRMQQLNTQFQSCADIDPTNLILCALICVDLSSRENEIHKLLDKYRILIPNKNKDTSCHKESYRIDHFIYHTFINFAKINKFEFWTSTMYSISNNNEEKINNLLLPSPLLDPITNIKSVEYDKDGDVIMSDV